MFFVYTQKKASVKKCNTNTEEINKYKIHLNWQDELVDIHSMEWVLSIKKYHLTDKDLRMRDGSATRNMYRPNWGPKFSSQYPHQETHNHLWDFRDLSAVFWPLKVACVFRHKLQKFKIIKWNYFPHFCWRLM